MLSAVLPTILAMSAMGAVPDGSPDANGPGPGLLRKAGIRPGRRHGDLAVLKEDARSNLTYAGCFLDLARRAGLRPEQLTLLSRGLGQEAGKLQEAGFGSVWDFDPYDLTDLTPDYKAMDRDNVLAIPDILRAATAQKEERRHDRLSV